MERNRTLAPLAFKRDRNRCQCGRLLCKLKERPKNELDGDHVVPLWDEGEDTLDNMQTLWRPHHIEKSNREARRRAAKKRRRPLPRARLSTAFVICGVGATVVQKMMLEPFGVEPHYFHTALATGSLAALPWLPSAARGWVGLGETNGATVTSKRTTLDPERIVEAAREAMGDRGDIVAEVHSSDSFSLTYAGTRFADRDAEKCVSFVDTMNAKLGGRWRAKWTTEQNLVTLSRREELPVLISHPGLPASRPWHVLPFGQSADGVVRFDLKKTSHLLIVGLTNSGKTSVMRVLIEALLDSARRDELELLMCDPKRVSLREYRDVKGVREVATSDEQLWETPQRFVREMKERYRLADEEGIPLDSHKPWVLLIDEYEEFIEVMTDYANELIEGDADARGNTKLVPREKITQKSPASPIKAVAQAARLAREAKMHLIIGTQRGDAELIGGRVRNNFGGRVLIGRAGPDESRMCFGVATYGRDVPAIAGRCTAQVGEGEPYEVQAWWVPKRSSTDSADRVILERLGAVG